MADVNDMDLMREYADRNSETAFAELVHRHINLVYSVALRYAGNSPDAHDVTQAVFVILAKKSAGLRQRTTLTGWLYETTRFTARQLLRTRVRQQAREQEAYMQSTLNDSNPDGIWKQLAPLLEEAMARLNEKERALVALRFFENKSAAETAALLGIQEWAAHKRSARAMEKLRQFFVKHGVSSATADIAGTISANSVQAAPVALAKAVTAIAVAKGAAASASTLTLIKGALKIMAWTKMKTAIVVGASVFLAAGTATVVVEKVSHPATSVADLSWTDDPKYWAMNSLVLNKLPAETFIVRQTRFANDVGIMQVGQRMVVKDYSVADLVDNAYKFSYSRTVFPPDMPNEHFDVMSTTTGGSEVPIKNELQKRFQLTAHPETRDTAVLVLKVQNPNPPGLKPHIGDDGNSSVKMPGNGKITIQNQELSGFIGMIESRVGTPVLDETGLTSHYDLQLQWNRRPDESDKDAFVRAVREQLGLALVPATRPVEMLVVEKAKN